MALNQQNYKYTLTYYLIKRMVNFQTVVLLQITFCKYTQTGTLEMDNGNTYRKQGTK